MGRSLLVLHLNFVWQAIDEKQNEATTYALNELARRKGDLEQNLKLAHELKVITESCLCFIFMLDSIN